MSLDIDHREKMKALNELVKMQKESKKRELIILAISTVSMIVSIISMIVPVIR